MRERAVQLLLKIRSLRFAAVSCPVVWSCARVPSPPPPPSPLEREPGRGGANFMASWQRCILATAHLTVVASGGWRRTGPAAIMSLCCKHSCCRRLLAKATCGRGRRRASTPAFQGVPSSGLPLAVTSTPAEATCDPKRTRVSPGLVGTTERMTEADRRSLAGCSLHLPEIHAMYCTLVGLLYLTGDPIELHTGYFFFSRTAKSVSASQCLSRLLDREWRVSPQKHQETLRLDCKTGIAHGTRVLDVK